MELQKVETFTDIAVMSLKQIEQLFDKFDRLNIKILNLFYDTGKPFPHDTSPHMFSLLYKKLGCSVGMEAIRKRLKLLVEAGLLEKSGRVGMGGVSYYPVKNLEGLVRKNIQLWVSKV